VNFRDKLSATGWIVAAVIAVIVFSVGAILVVGTISNETANFRGNVEAVNKTFGSGNHRIATYNRFFDICAGVQTSEASIRNLEQELKDPNTTTARASQIRGALTAIKTHRAELINQYNAEAANYYTKSFQDNNLPARLDINEENTTCAV
jgi:hypothetical protein